MYQRFVMVSAVPVRYRSEQQLVDAPFQNHIDHQEKHRRQRHHDHHHDGGDHGFPAGRPSDLVRFLAHFLKNSTGFVFAIFSPSPFIGLLAGAEGLEPSTCGFGDRRSTN